MLVNRSLLLLAIVAVAFVLFAAAPLVAADDVAATATRTVLTPGHGAKIAAGDVVHLHWEGHVIFTQPATRLVRYKSTRFVNEESTVEDTQPVVVTDWTTLASAAAFEGFPTPADHLIGMQVGEKTLIKIPSALAYGEQGYGMLAIKPGNDIRITVEIVDPDAKTEL
jgi:FKBP-type peptidyl-prolyl cis-trans isomerase 2